MHTTVPYSSIGRPSSAIPPSAAVMRRSIIGLLAGAAAWGISSAAGASMVNDYELVELSDARGHIVVFGGPVVRDDVSGQWEEAWGGNNVCASIETMPLIRKSPVGTLSIPVGPVWLGVGCGPIQPPPEIQAQTRPAIPHPADWILAMPSPHAESSKPLPVPAPRHSGRRALIADFDGEKGSDVLGGDFGSWDRDPGDDTQGCVMALDRGQPFGGAGRSVRLDYDVDSPHPAYNGFWLKLSGADFSDYSAIVLAVRGDPATGFTPRVKLELKNGRGEIGRHTLQGITGDWQTVHVPLSEFTGLTDRSEMKEFVVVFDDRTSVPSVGTLFLDDIAVE